MNQLSLSLPDTPPRYDESAFVISEANDAARQIARNWLQSEERVLIVCGPPKSGKTHLAHLVVIGEKAAFIAPQAASEPLPAGEIIVIDDLPGSDPHALIETLEDPANSDRRFVLAGAGHPAEWAMGLKDLRTRLEAMPRAVLNEPDETLIRAVIAKGFRDRQVVVNPAVIDFAAPRLPRTFAAAHSFVALADRAALDQKRKITVALVQKLIDNLSEGGFTA